MITCCGSNIPKVKKMKEAKISSTLLGKVKKIKLPKKWGSISVYPNEIGYVLGYYDSYDTYSSREIKKGPDPLLSAGLGAFIGHKTGAGAAKGGLAGYLGSSDSFYGTVAGGYLGSKADKPIEGAALGYLAHELLSQKETEYYSETHFYDVFICFRNDGGWFFLRCTDGKVAKMFGKTFVDNYEYSTREDVEAKIDYLAQKSL